MGEEFIAWRCASVTGLFARDLWLNGPGSEDCVINMHHLYKGTVPHSSAILDLSPIYNLALTRSFRGLGTRGQSFPL